MQQGYNDVEELTRHGVRSSWVAGKSYRETP